MQDLNSIKAKWLDATAAAGAIAARERVRVAARGKQGALAQRMKGLGALSPDERREQGARMNEVKDAVAAAIEARKGALAEAELERKLATERVDVTLPARPEAQGRLHPISQTVDEIVAIFGEMGFKVAEGPDIEDDFHNFTALNIPPEHPARQMHDTFYLAAGGDGELQSGGIAGVGGAGRGGAAPARGPRIRRPQAGPEHPRHAPTRPPRPGHGAPGHGRPAPGDGPPRRGGPPRRCRPPPGRRRR